MYCKKTTIWPSVFIAVFVLLCCSNVQTQETPKYRSCITDVQRYYYESPERIAKRFQLYKEYGVDMLRFEGLGWSACESAPDVWQPVEQMQNYLNMVKKFDFKIKLIAGTIMCPPAWYLDHVPDVQMTNQNGVVCRNTLNYWNPAIRPKLTEVLDHLFAYYESIGLLPYIEQVVVDFGQAGEPLYPPAWTLGAEYQGPETFWMYNRLAQEDFRAAMKAKYEFINIANAVWGTNFKSWDDVCILPPGQQKGPYWYDVLIRYRDVKRDFIIWQIDNFKRVLKKYGGTIKPVVYLGGRDDRPWMWEEAVQTGDGPVDIKLMCDLRWIARTAVEKECMLQYTGLENREEVEYLVKYLRDMNLPFKMWGENAGYYSCAKDPLNLANIIIENGLYGLDYTHSHFLFRSKSSHTPAWEQTPQSYSQTPADIEINPETGPKLKDAYALIKRHFEEQ